MREVDASPRGAREHERSLSARGARRAPGPACRARHHSHPAHPSGPPNASPRSTRSPHLARKIKSNKKNTESPGTRRSPPERCRPSAGCRRFDGRDGAPGTRPRITRRDARRRALLKHPARRRSRGSGSRSGSIPGGTGIARPAPAVASPRAPPPFPPPRPRGAEGRQRPTCSRRRSGGEGRGGPTWDGQVGERGAADAVGQSCHPVGELRLVLALRRSHAAVPGPLSYCRCNRSFQPAWPRPGPARPAPPRASQPRPRPLPLPGRALAARGARFLCGALLAWPPCRRSARPGCPRGGQGLATGASARPG